jgi:hypothetical protein
MLRCPDSCKMKKLHLENENGKLRRELMLLDEAKCNIEKQNRYFEQEVSIKMRNNENVRLKNYFAASKVRK